MKISQALILLIILIICQLSLSKEIAEDTTLETQVQELLSAENTENTDDVAQTLRWGRKLGHRIIRKAVPRINHAAIARAAFLKKSRAAAKLRAALKRKARTSRRKAAALRRKARSLAKAARKAKAAKKRAALALLKRKAAARALRKRAAALRRKAAALRKAKAAAARKARAAAKAKRHAKSYTCQAVGDPHMRNFQGQAYENQFSGDLTLFKKRGFRCDTRQMQWNGGRNFVNGRIACQVGHQHIEIFTPTDVRVNGVKAPTGTKKIGGVSFTWKGSHVEFSKHDTKVRVQIAKTRQPTWYMNFYITTRGLHGVTGLCNGKYDSRTKGTKPPRASPSILDGKAQRIKRRNPIKFGRRAVKWATGICKGKGLRGNSLHGCIFDVAATHKKKFAADMLRAQRLKDLMKRKHAAQRIAAAKARAIAARARAAAARARAKAAKRRAAFRKAKRLARAAKRAAQRARAKAARRKAAALRKAARLARAKARAAKREAKGKTFNCYATGDPHMKNFAGQKYENQFVGDFNIFSRAGFRCHTRQEFWNAQHTVAVNTRLACKVAGDHIEVYAPNDVRVNGKKISKGNHNLKSTAKLGFTGSQLTIHYAGSSVRSQINNGHGSGPLPRSYQNIYISTKGTKGLKGVTGLCNGSYDSRNKATKPPRANPSLVDGKGIRVQRPNPRKKFGHKAVAWATGICKGKGLKGNALHDCIFDVAATHKKRFAEAEKKLKALREKLRKRKAARRRAAARARRAARRARRAAARARAKAAALRRRAAARAAAKARAAKRRAEALKKRKTYNCYATGDPHMRNFAGKKYENQFSGDFRFFHKPGFRCDVRQLFWNVQRTVTVNKRVACKVGRNHVEVFGLNDIRINGKKYSKFNKKIGRGAKVSFDGRNFKVQNRNGDNVRAQIAGSKTRFYMNVYATARGLKHASGLCVGFYDSRKKGTKPPRAKPSLCDGKGIFKKPKAIKFGKRAVKWARGICKARKLKGAFFRNCVYDVAATHKKRFASLQARAKRMRNKLRRHRRARARKLRRARKAAFRRIFRVKRMKKRQARRKVKALKRRVRRARKFARRLKRRSAKRAARIARRAKRSARKAARRARRAARKAARKARKAARKNTPANKKAALKKLIAARRAKRIAQRKLKRARKLRRIARKLRRRSQTKRQKLKSALRVRRFRNQKLKLCYKTTSSNDYDVKKVSKVFKPTKSDEKNIIGKAM
eukprot:gene3656-6472_t